LFYLAEEIRVVFPLLQQLFKPCLPLGRLSGLLRQGAGGVKHVASHEVFKEIPFPYSADFFWKKVRVIQSALQIKVGVDRFEGSRLYVQSRIGRRRGGAEVPLLCRKYYPTFA
jgi:hypothetical protein